MSFLEGKTGEPATFDLAQGIAKRLDELDQEFRKHQYQLLDLIDETDEEALAKEQAELDGHDDVRIKQLVAVSSSSAYSSKRKALSHQQARLEKAVISIRDAVRHLTTTSDNCLIRQYGERLYIYKLTKLT